MEPYYDDLAHGLTVYHAPMEQVLATLEPECAALVLLDPPYSDKTHKGAQTLKKKSIDQRGTALQIDFQSASVDQIIEWLKDIERVAARWIVGTMDWRHVAALETFLPEGLRFMQFGIWIKTNPAPQFHGKSPGSGWEAVAHLHKVNQPLAWNGGGRVGLYHHATVQTARYPSEKPLTLHMELIRLFSSPGDLVVEPFMGSGTGGEACKRLGRRYIGCDIAERACKIAAKRIASAPAYNAALDPDRGTQMKLYEMGA